ncbi:MAG TPA: TonB-dependent receptor [Steroidobacteraceae bacterium]|nr:TonB-dependent receptor [Steroidobacteraceae bacterium]
MSDSSKKPGKHADFFRVSSLLTATAIWSFANGAAAQDATPTATDTPEGAEQIDEVVVTGFRASLNKALDAKQEQVGAIDMIVAEDIADFPDLNLAESLQRVPGVVIARDAGEGRQISVRGLGPQFTRVRINGVEAMSANGGTDAAGGTNRSRSFDFNTFASELFNTITIRKSAAAEIEEGSLGATVDLRTGRPFDYDGLTLVGSLQAGYNDLNSETDPRATFLVSNSFADGKLGALLSVAYTKRNLADEGSSTVRWMNAGNPTTNCLTFAAVAANTNCFGPLDPAYPATGSPTLAQINSAFRPRIPRYDKYEHEQERIGVTTSFQYAPSDATALNLDVLYAQFDAERSEIFLETPIFSTAGNAMGVLNQGINDVNPVAAEIDGTNTLVYGVFNDVDVRSEARLDELSTKFTQVTLDGKHSFTDTLALSALVGFAESNHENPVQTTLLFDAIDIDGYSYDYRGDSRLPLITYGTLNTSAPGQWALTQIRLRPQSTINSYQTANLELEWAASDNFTLKFGPDWKNFVYRTTELRRSNGTTANIEGTIPTIANGTNAPIPTYSEITTFGDGLDLPAGSTTSWLVPDVATAYDVLDLNNRTIYPLGTQPALGNNAEVEEDDLGAFLQGDFSFELGGRTLRGNLGVRYVETSLTTTGYAYQTGGPVQITVETDYDDVLPSLNLVYDISDSLLVRLSGAKVMTRPNLGNLSPGAAVGVAGNNRTVTAGNPFLDPFRANSYDASIEWYFAPESLLSLALFYKDITSFVTNVRSDIPFTGNPLGIPDSVAISACGTVAGCSPAALWAFTVPTNTDGGEVQGFEISYQQPFTFLPGFWSNFGTILNYTGVESEVNYLNSLGQTVSADLAGLSDSSYNATLYFDNKVFSARVAAAYRSEYLTTIPGRDGNDVEGTADTLNIDFSSTYNITDQFSVSLEALNLTDEVQDQWVDSVGDRLSFYHHQGRQYYIGARFKY